MSSPETAPAGLVSQRNACSVLLEHAEAIPDSLEAELYAYTQMLDHAIAQHQKA